MPYYTMNKKDKTGSLSIFAEIGKDWWGDGTTVEAQQFKKDLDNLGEIDTLNIDINSPGGSFFEGLAIYNILKRTKATKNVTILGLAASAASTIAMVGDTVSMSEDSYIMIHNAHSMTWGDAREMEKVANELKQFDGTIANIYAKKTGMGEEEIRELMNNETWMNGAECKEKGFCDEVTDAKEVAACFKLDKFKNAPKNLAVTTPEPEPKAMGDDIYAMSLDILKRRIRK